MANETAIQTRIGSLSETMAAKYDMDWQKFLETFKATVFKSCKRPPTSEELAMMMMVSKQYDLNPFIGQIFAFLAKNGAIIPVVGVDGFVAIAERNRDNDGHEMFVSDKMVSLPDAKPCPEWCEIKIYRKNLSHPIVVREYLDEVYVPPRGENKTIGPWQTHTKRMLRHKTIVQGNRIAYAITGIYDEDEAHRIDDMIVDVKVKPFVNPAQAIDPVKELAEENFPFPEEQPKKEEPVVSPEETKKEEEQKPGKPISQKQIDLIKKLVKHYKDKSAGKLAVLLSKERAGNIESLSAFGASNIINTMLEDIEKDKGANKDAGDNL